MIPYKITESDLWYISLDDKKAIVIDYKLWSPKTVHFDAILSLSTITTLTRIYVGRIQTELL